MDAKTIHDRRWFTLLVLCFSLMVIGLDNTILNVALPTLVRQLHASESQLQWMVDSYVLVFAGLLLTAGSLGDRFGRKRALTAGLLAFGVGSGLSALATTSSQLIATRSLMGIGGAFIMPSTLSILTNVFTDPAERGRAIGVWAGVSALGIAAGPVIGGWLLQHFWYGSVFTVNLPVVVLAVIAGRFLVPESKDPSAPRLDPVGALLSIGALTALLYAIIEAPVHGWTDVHTVAAFVLGGVVLAQFAMWELRTDHPMLDLRFFENPRFTAASAAITLVFFALFGSLFFLTQYLQFVLGYGALEAGVRLVPMAVVLIVAAPLSARWVERFGTKRVVTAGLTIVTIAFLVLSRASTGTGYGLVLVGTMILALGMGNVMAPATESIMGSLPLGKAGVGSAVNDTTRQVGGALGVAVLGSLLASAYGSKVAHLLRRTSVPGASAKALRSSVGAALQIGHAVGGAPGRALVTGARSAFIHAMDLSLVVAGGVALVGAVIVARFLPARAPRPIGDPAAVLPVAELDVAALDVAGLDAAELDVVGA
ncbi:MAG: DHA2 family efflux MFS transporter permease subunit [Acidimicrobiales bacterium]